MRLFHVGLLAFLLAVAPAISLCEPKGPCPPLDQVSPVRRAAKVLNDKTAPKFDIARDVPSLSIVEYAPMCKRQPTLVACAGGGTGKLTMAEVQRIDARLRASFEYRDDILVWGRTDYWSAGSLCGDCEDYALNLSERLHAEGQGGENMGLVMWLTGEFGHATLAVDTSDVGMVEVGVGDGLPAPMVWKTGVRVAVLWMDGKRQFSAPPGWPAPAVKFGSVSAPDLAKR